MDREQRRTISWIPIAVVIVLISLIVINSQSKQNMNVYQGTEPSASTAPTKANIPLVEHKSEMLNLTYGVPDGWTKVNKDGHLMYIHAPSSTSMEIIIEDYAPNIMSANEKAAQEQCQKDGSSFISFSWSGNTKYMTLYQKQHETSSTFFIEVVSFDKKHIVRTKYSLEEIYYDQMIDTITTMIDAVKWEKEDPYPINMSLVYSEYGNFEFAHPNDWHTGFQNNTYFAQDPNTKTIMSINVSESKVTYESLDKYDYIKWAASGRNSFNCQTFEKTNGSIYAVSSHTASGTGMMLVQYMIATGEYEYIMTFDIPQKAYSSFSSTLHSLMGLLKIYVIESSEGGI